MRLKTFMHLAALAMTALSLGGCANLERHTPSAVSQADDDAYCQTKGGRRARWPIPPAARTATSPPLSRTAWSGPTTISPSGC